jgi:hypothetical protein
MPAAHVAPPVQLRPHVPQLPESVCRFVHAAPHRVPPFGHAQDPAAHC